MSEGHVKKSFHHRQRPNNKQKHCLEAGQNGFFCTCHFRCKDSVKEAYDLLNEYGDKLYGSTEKEAKPADGDTSQEEAGGDAPETEDISDRLKKEVDELKSRAKKDIKEKRYQAVDTGASNCIFIRTNLPNPEHVTAAIFKDLVESKQQKTLYLLRILPIMATCKANLLDITQTAGKIFDECFLKEPSTFSIIFNKRYHSKLSRDEVITELANIIALKNSGNKADLKHPQKAVIVEIIKEICLLSVVENFYKFRKYNMFEICKKEEDKTKEDDKPEKENGEAKEAAEKTESGRGDGDKIAEKNETVRESTKAAEENGGKKAEDELQKTSSAAGGGGVK